MEIVSSAEGRVLLQFDVTVPSEAVPGSTLVCTVDLQDLVSWVWQSGAVSHTFPLSQDAVREIAELAIAEGVVRAPGQREVIVRLDRIAAALDKPRGIEFLRDEAGRITGMRAEVKRDAAQG